jgi:hypothetical protein
MGEPTEALGFTVEPLGVGCPLCGSGGALNKRRVFSKERPLLEFAPR